MNNEKKVISYIEKEANFNGSFKDIENRINFQNIVIKNKENKMNNFKNGFRRLKIASLCLICSVLCFVGGYVVSQINNNQFKIINSYFEYDTYEEFEKAVYEYEELYPEQKLKVFDINIDGVIDYEYRINGEIKYKNKDELVSFMYRMPTINIKFLNNESYLMHFRYSYFGGNYYIEDINKYIHFYEFDSNGDKYIDPFITIKIDNKRNNLDTVTSYISSNIHLLEV